MDGLFRWLSAPVSPTVTRAELVWVPFVLVAFLLCVWMTADRARSLLAVSRARRNGALRAISRSELRREALDLLVCAGMAHTAWALLTDHPYTRLVFTAAMLVYAWATCANKLLDRVYRHGRERYYERLVRHVRPPAAGGAGGAGGAP
jgi:hypothetical protein